MITDRLYIHHRNSSVDGRAERARKLLCRLQLDPGDGRQTCRLQHARTRSTSREQCCQCCCWPVMKWNNDCGPVRSVHVSGDAVRIWGNGDGTSAVSLSTLKSRLHSGSQQRQRLSFSAYDLQLAPRGPETDAACSIT